MPGKSAWTSAFVFLYGRRSSHTYLCFASYRTKEEMYRYLSIDITDNEASPQDVDGGTPPAKHTVEKCLEQFFRPEARELKCEKCEEGQEATQTMRILSTPKAMLLHLKRFVFVEKEMTFQKNKVRLGAATIGIRQLVGIQMLTKIFYHFLCFPGSGHTLREAVARFLPQR
jgi:uncharacterized UBP type Zn finger protein